MRATVILILLFSTSLIHAQPLVQHNLYPFNPNFANPAATGMTTCLEMVTTDMHQWIGFTDAPNTQSFSIQQGRPAFKTKKYGLGLNVIRDVNGPSKSHGGELLYSFHFLVGRARTTWLSFGLSGNIEQRRVDESEFSPVFDPAVSGGMEEELAVNASGGVYMYNDRYFAGIALYNLLPVNSTLGLGYGGDRYFVSFQGGYLFHGKNLPFTVKTSVQGNMGKAVYQFDINNTLRFQGNIWAGLTLRKYLGEYETSGQNALVFLGYDWNNWSFCYNYDFDINGTQFHHYGTHQFSIGFRICHEDTSCPAYR